MSKHDRPQDLCSSLLLRPGVARRLADCHARYPEHYDDVLIDVHTRLQSQGAATKLDLAALIAWKHVRNAPWMKALLAMPSVEVEAITRRALAPRLADDDRIAELRPLPGFGSGGAFTSVLLTAWDPDSFGVFDRLVFEKRSSAVIDECACDWSHLPTYWAHLRVIASELEDLAPDIGWTPRKVDMALMNLDV